MVLGFNKRMQSKPARYATEQLPTGLAPTRKSDAERTLQSYDYVIVGAGTAGSVLASRLSEDPNVTVLVLEAGCDNRGVLASKIPLMISKMFHSEYDWNYYTAPQAQVENRRLFWPRGRIVGGSSSMNAMMMHHCDAHDFDEWANEYGCAGWSYDDLRPYFRKSERFTPNPNRPAINPEHRGDSGVWQTGYSWLTEIGEKGFLGACEQVGIAHNEDINTPKGTLGATRFQTFIDARGQRSSAATAYLPQHVVNRKNLTIATGVVVAKVLFDLTTGDQPTAIGVALQQTRGGPVYQVHARKEVVLCGGAINTPQLLLLSGVGPDEQLSKHGVAVVMQNENVGRHVKDHLCPSPLLLKAKRGVTLDYLASDVKALPSLARWLLTGGGPLTSNSGEVAAFVRAAEPPFALPSTSKVRPKDYGAGGVGPDLELIGLPLGLVHHGESRPPDEADAYSLVACGLRPQSHGTITLQSTDAFDHPHIDPRYWTDDGDNDRSVLMVAIRIMLKMARADAMKPFLERVEPNDDVNSAWWPYSATNIDAITDEQLRKWMGHGASTLYHPVGSARMGADAKDSVVDLQLRVHGVRGLRVVDASIFPQQVSGHPTAPIIAIAEKASELIRGSTSSAAPAPVMAKL